MWGAVKGFQGWSQEHTWAVRVREPQTPPRRLSPACFVPPSLSEPLQKQIKTQNSPRLAGICSLFSKLLCCSSTGLESLQLWLYGDVSRRVHYRCSIGQPESPAAAKSTFLVLFVPYATM